MAASVIGIIENGNYPWLDPSFMGFMPEQPWVRYAPFGLLHPSSPDRHWQLWEIIGHYGDQLQESLVEAAYWVRFSESL